MLSTGLLGENKGRKKKKLKRYHALTPHPVLKVIARSYKKPKRSDFLPKIMVNWTGLECRRVFRFFICASDYQNLKIRPGRDDVMS